MSDSMAAQTYSVPGWFVKFCAFVLVLMIPWASWVTIELTKMSVKLEKNLELEGKLQSHEKDHITRREHDGLVRRVEKLEK